MKSSDITKTNKVNLFVAYVLLSSTAKAITTPSSTWSSNSNKTSAESFLAIKHMLTGRLNARFNVPPRYYRKPSNFVLQYEPFQIIKVDELFQSITISCSITLTWKDYNIQWDPDTFHNITNIEMPSYLFWTPSVLVPKTTQKRAIQLRIPNLLSTTYEGHVNAQMTGFTDTLCNLNMAEFPFDSHNCTLIFLESEKYNITAHMPPRREKKDFGTNAAWILLNYGCKSTKVRSFKPQFYYVTCFVHIRRRSAFYVANLLAPIVLTSLMTLMVFWIPAESGEKISFLVSMFTSSSVFLNYMIDMIPRSVEILPQINILVVAIQVQIILATMATAFVLRLHKHEQQKLLLKQRETPGLPVQHHQQTGIPQSSERYQIKPQRACKFWRENAIHPVPMIHTKVQEFSNDKVKHRLQLTNIDSSHIDDPLVCDSDKIAIFAGQEVQELAGEDLEMKTCLRTGSLRHEQLDIVFFAVLSALTIAVYLLVFLRS